MVSVRNLVSLKRHQSEIYVSGLMTASPNPKSNPNPKPFGLMTFWTEIDTQLGVRYLVNFPICIMTMCNLFSTSRPNPDNICYTFL